MADRFYIKQNDTSPALQVQLQDENEDPVGELQSGDTVRFHMVDADGNVVVDGAGNIDSVTDSLVSYGWSAGDTDTVDTFQAEFEVTFQTNGKTETFPNSHDILVVVEDELN